MGTNFRGKCPLDFSLRIALPRRKKLLSRLPLESVGVIGGVQTFSAPSFGGRGVIENVLFFEKPNVIEFSGFLSQLGLQLRKAPRSFCVVRGGGYNVARLPSPHMGTVGELRARQVTYTFEMRNIDILDRLWGFFLFSGLQLEKPPRSRCMGLFVGYNIARLPFSEMGTVGEL